MLPQPTSTTWRLPHLGDVELLHARHQTHTFPRHTHERYAIGVIEEGALGYFYRGENVVAATGQINLCIPGEVHTGHPASAAGWSYRMFYLDPAILQRVASEMGERPFGVPFFQPGRLHDPQLARQLRQVHIQLQAGDGPLQQESLLLDLLACLIARHADDPPATYQITAEPQAVALVKAYLHAHFAEDISLEQLSRLTHLSRFHLLRLFREAQGVPPHAYLRQIRVRQAKARLLGGDSIADAARACGFTDQSHLTRWMKRLWGITPGQYRNSVQDAGA